MLNKSNKKNLDNGRNNKISKSSKKSFRRNIKRQNLTKKMHGGVNHNINPTYSPGGRDFFNKRSKNYYQSVEEAEAEEALRLKQLLSSKKSIFLRQKSVKGKGPYLSLSKRKSRHSTTDGDSGVGMTSSDSENETNTDTDKLRLVTYEPKIPNILIYFGCFCPPHKGHFLNVKNNINKFDKIYVFIFNPESLRHGINTDDNVRIWELYKSLLTPIEQLKLILIKSKYKSVHPFTGGIDKMRADIDITFPALQYKKYKVNLLLGDDYNNTKSTQSTETIADYCNHSPRCVYNNDFIKIQRSQTPVSATDFIKIIKAKKTKQETIVEYADIESFLPYELSIPKNQTILDNLLKVINNFDIKKLK